MHRLCCGSRLPVKWKRAFGITFILVVVFVLRYKKPPGPSVNIVVASTREKDLSWTRKIKIRNANIIPYVADDAQAEFHPTANKGREAMVYLTYLHDFYNVLPDISIFVHGDELSW
jgi:hypothetical protein